MWWRLEPQCISYKMNLSGGSACIKYLIFIFNLVFVVSVSYCTITGHKIRRVCQKIDVVYGAALCNRRQWFLCYTLEGYDPRILFFCRQPDGTFVIRVCSMYWSYMISFALYYKCID